MLTCVVNQNVPHHLCDHCKEVGAILPIDFLLTGQTKVRLVDESGGLQRVTIALTLNIAMRIAPQFVIDQRRQSIERSFASLAPFQEQPRQVITCQRSQSTHRRQILAPFVLARSWTLLVSGFENRLENIFVFR